MLEGGEGSVPLRYKAMRQHGDHVTGEVRWQVTPRPLERRGWQLPGLRGQAISSVSRGRAGGGGRKAEKSISGKVARSGVTWEPGHPGTHCQRAGRYGQCPTVPRKTQANSGCSESLPGTGGRGAWGRPWTPDCTLYPTFSAVTHPCLPCSPLTSLQGPRPLPTHIHPPTSIQGLVQPSSNTHTHPWIHVLHPHPNQSWFGMGV